jgi:hypothetical protein
MPSDEALPNQAPPADVVSREQPRSLNSTPSDAASLTAICMSTAEPETAIYLRSTPLDSVPSVGQQQRHMLAVASVSKRHFWDRLPDTTGTSIRTSDGPSYHRSRRAPEDAQASASESMQDESALASFDLAGLESVRSICSSTASTAVAADVRVRRPAPVSAAWRTRWCCG